MSRRRVFLVASILTLALIVSAMFRRPPSIAQEPPATEAPRGLPELQGTISCATSVCHGGNDLRQPRSEASTWLAFDPHARAYDTLLSDSAKRIAKVLWGGTPPAHQKMLCVKCHVHPDYDVEQPTKNTRPHFRKEDGVGCESCHGAAQQWVTPHYQSPWKKLNSADKAKRGLTDTKDLRVRAEVCSGCHVGRPGADVDHELIAAGHPALRFEFATYFANLPPHWNVKQDQQRAGPDFEASSWEIGQLVTAKNALELLAHRADPQTARTWPEFAELDCFACHHDLQGAHWRRDQKHLHNRKLGTLLWNDWYYAMVPEPKGTDLVRAFKAGREPLRRHELFTSEGRRDLARQAKDLALTLAAVARTPPTGALHRLRNDRTLDRSWDEATQRYLALVTLRQAYQDTEERLPADLERRIADLRRDVTFRAFNSPQHFVPAGLRLPGDK